MGASFKTMTVKGEQTRDEVRAAFEQAQADDRFENGNMYSGGFGQCSGLDFPNETFDTIDAAEEWLVEHCQKWEAARCVTFKEAGQPAMWLIGAWCAS